MKEKNEYPSYLIKNIGTAKKLKKIGFDIPCNFFLPLKMYGDFDIKELDFDFKAENYNNSYDYLSIPTYVEVLEWFGKKGFIIILENHKNSSKFMFHNINDKKYFKGESSNYEKAMEELIDKLIKVYESKNEQEIQKLNM